LVGGLVKVERCSGHCSDVPQILEMLKKLGCGTAMVFVLEFSGR